MVNIARLPTSAIVSTLVDLDMPMWYRFEASAMWARAAVRERMPSIYEAVKARSVWAWPTELCARGDVTTLWVLYGDIIMFREYSPATLQTTLTSDDAVPSSTALWLLERPGAASIASTMRARGGLSALHLCVKHGRISVARRLLRFRGVIIDVRDDRGFTPLSWAVMKNATELAFLLLDRGADPNVKCDVDRYSKNKPFLVFTLLKRMDAMTQRLLETPGVHVDASVLAYIPRAGPIRELFARHGYATPPPVQKKVLNSPLEMMRTGCVASAGNATSDGGRQRLPTDLAVQLLRGEPTPPKIQTRKPIQTQDVWTW
eukprot:TRINITY_DN25297_c0_g1_i1.p1 TRINITY_DN25297_c0_g1~~TRINITY_DN25297_c0_g1_i1.p1  ORF type:complete len:317 (-),score=34.73 TRINITY_DN25297_c0_g1_i1:110-1060(-)